MGLASTGIQFHFRTPSRQPTHQRRCPFPTPMPRGVLPLPKVERAEGQSVRIVATAAANGWELQSLRREQLAHNDLRPLIREVESGKCPEWKDASDRGPVYTSYWAQWNSFAFKDCVLERQWESADGKEKTVLIFIPYSMLKEVLAEMHGGISGHLGVKIINNVRQRYCWLHLRGDVQSVCQRCDLCRKPRTKNQKPGTNSPI